MRDQLTIQHAIAERIAQDGMDRALEHAESKHPKWGDLAVDYIRRYAIANETFAGWMVVKAASLDPNFPTPATEKAWGQPFKVAAKKGYIRKEDKPTKDPHRHGNPIPVWRSLIFGRAA